MKNNLLCVTPIAHYTAPNIPTFEAANHDPSLLEKLPDRWAKKASVIACLGFAGMFALSGCFGPFANRGGAPPIYRLYQVDAEILTQITQRLEAARLELQVHHGGEGAGPYYVAHFTEQEALGFIRSKLEAVGFDFGAAPPEDIVVSTWWQEFGIDLYDEARGVGISHIAWQDSRMPFALQGSELINYVAHGFAEQAEDISVGVFSNPGEIVGWGPFAWRGEDSPYKAPTEENKEAARPLLIESLTAQVQEFIDWLKAQGIV